jgi:hypothetical protein
MNATLSQEAELITRSVARWGSLTAAVLYGVVWATDKVQDPVLSLDLAVYTTATTLVFVGYALAWREPWEVIGSVLALVATVTAYTCLSFGPMPLPSPLLLLVGVPALLHLLAVGLHRLPHVRPAKPTTAG